MWHAASLHPRKGEFIMIRKMHLLPLALIALLSAGPSFSAEKSVDIYILTDNVAKKGIGEKIGTIALQETGQGLQLQTHLKGLPPGEHGFHVHENPSCEGVIEGTQWVEGQAAGGHLDPQHTGKHAGPSGHGHLGDLPVLVVDKNGDSQITIVAPHLKLSDVVGRSFIIHKGGDNYTDQPPMGGGGPRIACGVIN